MNELFSIDELTVMRHALNVITIQGKDAKPIAMLQDKLEGLIAQQQIERQEKIPTKK
jgi:hypothetical protein